MMRGPQYGRSAPLHVPEPLIIATVVLLVGSVAASFVDRLGAPTLLVFLGLGMLLGEDGPGGIQFDNATLARDAGTVALMIILLEGGFLAERSEVMRALGPAGLLASLGVLLTAGVVALAAHAFIGLGWTTALLLGAAVSSTDAAAVFAALRGTPRAAQGRGRARGRERAQRSVRRAARDRPGGVEHERLRHR